MESLQLVSKAAVALLPIIITFSLIINSFMNVDTKALFFIFGLQRIPYMSCAGFSLCDDWL